MQYIILIYDNFTEIAWLHHAPKHKVQQCKDPKVVPFQIWTRDLRVAGVHNLVDHAWESGQQNSSVFSGVCRIEASKSLYCWPYDQYLRHNAVKSLPGTKTRWPKIMLPGSSKRSGICIPPMNTHSHIAPFALLIRRAAFPKCVPRKVSHQSFTNRPTMCRPTNIVTFGHPHYKQAPKARWCRRRTWQFEGAVHLRSHRYIC